MLKGRSEFGEFTLDGIDIHTESLTLRKIHTYAISLPFKANEGYYEFAVFTKMSNFGDHFVIVEQDIPEDDGLVH